MTAAHGPGKRVCRLSLQATICHHLFAQRRPFHQAGEPKPSLAGLGQERLGALLSISLAGFDAAQGEKEPVRSLIEAGRRCARRAAQVYLLRTNRAARGVVLCPLL
jgi:hypothetical protein